MKLLEKFVILLITFFLFISVNVFGYSKPPQFREMPNLGEKLDIITLPRAMNETEPDIIIIDEDRIIVTADKCYVYSLNGDFLFRFTPRGDIKVAPNGDYYAYNWWDRIFMKFDRNGNLISKFGKELINKLPGDIDNGLGEETFDFLSNGSVVIACSPSISSSNRSTKCVIVDKNWEKIIKTFSINNEQNGYSERIRNFKIFNDNIFIATLEAETISIYNSDGKFIEYLYGLEKNEKGEIFKVPIPNIKAFTKRGDILFLKDGSLYLCDSETFFIRRLPIKGDYNHLLSVATKDNDIYIIECSKENRYNRTIKKFTPPDYKSEIIAEFYERGSKSMFKYPIHCIPLKEGRFLIIDSGVQLLKIVRWNNLSCRWILEKIIPFPGTFTFSVENMGILQENEIIGTYWDFYDNKKKVIKVSLIDGSIQDMFTDDELPVFIKSFSAFPETVFMVFEEKSTVYRIKSIGELSDFDLKIEIDKNRLIDSFCVLPSRDVAFAMRPMPVAGRNIDLNPRIVVYDGKDGKVKKEIIITPSIAGTMRITSTESGEIILVNNRTSHIFVVKSNLSDLLVNEFPPVDNDESEPHLEFSEDFINSFQGIGFAVNVYAKEEEIYVCDTLFKRVFIASLNKIYSPQRIN